MAKQKKWKKVLGTVAPTLAGAFFGPLGGLAANTLTKAIGISDGSGLDEDALENILGGVLNPELMAQLKQAELQFEKELKELDIDLERIAADDRGSARNREVQLRDWTPKLLASGIVVGFFGILFVLMNAPEGQINEALLILVGALGAGLTQVLNYYFGSSVGSKDKTTILSQRRE